MKLISVVQQYGQHFVIYIPRIERTEKGNLIIMHASITHIKKIYGANPHYTSILGSYLLRENHFTT